MKTSVVTNVGGEIFLGLNQGAPGGTVRTRYPEVEIYKPLKWPVAGISPCIADQILSMQLSRFAQIVELKSYSKVGGGGYGKHRNKMVIRLFLADSYI